VTAEQEELHDIIHTIGNYEVCLLGRALECVWSSDLANLVQRLSTEGLAAQGWIWEVPQQPAKWVLIAGSADRRPIWQKGLKRKPGNPSQVVLHPLPDAHIHGARKCF